MFAAVRGRLIDPDMTRIDKPAAAVPAGAIEPQIQSLEVRSAGNCGPAGIGIITPVTQFIQLNSIFFADLHLQIFTFFAIGKILLFRVSKPVKFTDLCIYQFLY